MQQWEYTRVLRSRTWENEKGKAFSLAKDWVNFLNDKLIEKKIDQILAELGTAGWELVAISPRSDYLGSYVENNFYNGTGSDISSDYAGFTNTEEWVFKRPK